jgi:sugar/nucleoside kinase (ribokinase family)
MFDVFALGDMIVDFTPLPSSKNGNPVYECNPGGTVANMAAVTAVLGLKTILAGKVGDEDLGRFIEKVLASKGVDTSGVVFDKLHFSTQTFVTLKNGERSFIFSRKYAADIFYFKDDIDLDKLRASKIFHISGMNFTDDPCKTATFYALDQVRRTGIIRTLDVNYRPALWKSEKDFCETMPEVIKQIDIYKGSDEETLILTGEKTLDKAAEKIRSWGPELIFISGGYRGAYFYYEGISGILNTYNTKRVDTTGAGDCFMGAILYRVIRRNGIKDFSREELEDIVDFANAAGAVSITGRGGIASVPTLDNVEVCRKSIKKLIVPW